MRKVAFLGLLASMTMIPVAAQAQSDSGATSTAAGVALATQAVRGMRGNHGMRGGNQGGTRVWRGGGQQYRYHGGGGFNRGTRFYAGGFLPSYFMAPRYYVVNYPRYGLVQPRSGYRWVRYYDDAYLVDGRGYIADQRYGVPYEGNGGGYYRDDRQSYDDRAYDDREYYDDRRYSDDRRRGNSGDGAAGAIVGGIVGGIAGNRIAGRGNRTEGTIIGGAIGAIAGGVIGSEAGRSDRYDDRYRDDRYDDNRRDRHHSDRGHREDRHHSDRRHSDEQRHYNSGPVPEYVGRGDYYPPNAPQMEYGADYDRDYRSEERYIEYPPVQQQAPVRTHIGVSGPGTYAINHANGISQSASTTIVVNSAPATTTTTTTFIEEEVEYVAPRRSTRRAARPIAQTRNCNCR